MLRLFCSTVKCRRPLDFIGSIDSIWVELWLETETKCLKQGCAIWGALENNTRWNQHFSQPFGSGHIQALIHLLGNPQSKFRPQNVGVDNFERILECAFLNAICREVNKIEKGNNLANTAFKRPKTFTRTSPWFVSFLHLEDQKSFLEVFKLKTYWKLVFFKLLGNT